jgi:hypothetical protein
MKRGDLCRERVLASRARELNVVLLKKTTAIMTSMIDAPVEWVETVSNLGLPAKADRRLQQLMDRNNEGLLTEVERADLEFLVELSERTSLVRAEALRLLGRQPA